MSQLVFVATLGAASWLLLVNIAYSAYLIIQWLT